MDQLTALMHASLCGPQRTTYAEADVIHLVVVNALMLKAAGRACSLSCRCAQYALKSFTRYTSPAWRNPEWLKTLATAVTFWSDSDPPLAFASDLPTHTQITF